MLFVSQKVIDIKTPLDLPNLARRMGELRGWLREHGFIEQIDKFTGELADFRIDKEGNLSCTLTGGSLGSTSNGVQPAILLTLPLGLTDYRGELHTQAIFGAVAGTLIDDGGNIQNMLLNILVIAEALSRVNPQFNSQNLPITTATNSDPFQRLDSQIVNLFRKRVNVYPLGMPDRFAVHLPYEHAGKRGILPITSEPKETYQPLLKLLSDNVQFAREFGSATCFVSSDPFFQILPTHAMAPYAYIINASTAFRGLVAVSAYGYNALLPMNQGEAGEVCKLMLSRARGTELDRTETPRFPSPLTIKEDAIDPNSLEILDSSIDAFSRHNPFFQQAEGFSFACPISFGQEGGLIIGMNKEPIACFTSIPSQTGENLLFSKYSFPRSEQIQETGAGDSVAAVVALFNTVSPDVLIAPYLEGRETDHKELRQLATTVFVSCLSRIVGNLLIRTHRTNLTHIEIDPLGSLIQDVAKESVELARKSIKLLPDPTFAVIEEWDIKVAMWEPRRLVVPSGVPLRIT